MAACRHQYQAELAAGTERFFAPRREDCPWCGSRRLRVRLRTTDLLQHKPGQFVLDACDTCGHVFQNPQLNENGLAFYYRDFYDGLGEENLAGLFRSHGRFHRPRAESVLPFTRAPKTWLDVGTGHGHFCEAARTVLPGTVFDGLDIGAGVGSAERRGLLRRGYRGSFTGLAPQLATDGYDVISMFHYLEHSADPDAELDAARRVLHSGGLLVVEVPDPASRFARLLGRWWLPWLQPQHLHLFPVGNLRRRLADHGFTVVAEEHAAAHDPVDLVAATCLAVNRVAPRRDEPWYAEAPGTLRRVLRGAVLGAGVPFVVVAHLLDLLLRPVAHRWGLSNAYRVVARREEP
ncbi:class I SAM-dependent methyltransferase [Streptomyces sp. NPDC047108]|uniref:class I SAM-dependent methyltransferase n=1 Tax=Streptomyces sp. NPDC047108 TaxID=3155025 RepID=UPI0033D1ACFC